MKCICSLEKIRDAVNLGERIAGKSASLPVLSFVKLSVSQNTLSLSATNLEIGVETKINAKVEKDGDIVVPASILNQFFTTLKHGDRIQLEVSNNTLHISSSEQKTKIKGGDQKNFPLIPKKESAQPITLNTQQLSHILHKTAFATSVNETRPELTGVFLAFDEKNLRAAATDSFRLTQSCAPFATKDTPAHYMDYVDTIKSIILPKHTCQELLHILPKTNNITMAIEGSQVFFTTENTTIISRVIEGNYPDYQQIIPQKHTTTLHIEKTALLDAVRAAAVFAKKQTPECTFSIQKGALTINAESHDTGSTSVTVPADITGEDLTVVLNAHYVVEGVALCDTDQVSIALTTSAAPVVFSPEKKEDGDLLGDYLYIVMPIKNTQAQ